MDSALERRDFCDNARAAARTSANSGQSCAMWDRMARLSGGAPPAAASVDMLPCGKERYLCYSADGGKIGANADRTAAAE